MKNPSGKGWRYLRIREILRRHRAAARTVDYRAASHGLLRLYAAAGWAHLFRSAIQNHGRSGGGGIQGKSESQAGEESGRSLDIYQELGGQARNAALRN